MPREGSRASIDSGSRLASALHDKVSTETGRRVRPGFTPWQTGSSVGGGGSQQCRDHADYSGSDGTIAGENWSATFAAVVHAACPRAVLWLPSRHLAGEQVTMSRVDLSRPGSWAALFPHALALMAHLERQTHEPLHLGKGDRFIYSPTHGAR
jgi:hypothetical protein